MIIEVIITYGCLQL